MSELNVYHHELRHNEYAEFYLKSEADKVIENIVKGAVSMFREPGCCRGLDTKSPLGRIADVAFKHWNGVEYTRSNNRQLRLDKANLLCSNEQLRTQLKSETTGRMSDKIEYALNIRHQKYKRCLAMAKLCNEKWLVHNFAEIPTKLGFYDKWEKRWLELAEKFKPNKEAK